MYIMNILKEFIMRIYVNESWASDEWAVDVLKGCRKAIMEKYNLKALTFSYSLNQNGPDNFSSKVKNELSAAIINDLEKATDIATINSDEAESAPEPNNVTLIRFLKMYSIYYRLHEIDTKEIEINYNRYLAAIKDGIGPESEMAAMKNFILYGKIK